MYLMITELLSGLALFLFGMKYMSESLQQAAGEKLRSFLDRCTKNKYVAIVFGALFTAFIQSSGATTVMEVGFVNAGILTLEKSIGLTFGANIGTTITSQLVSLKLTEIAPFIIFIGAAIMSFCKKPLLKRISAVIFGFGALFTGINFMTGALQGMAGYQSIQDAFRFMSIPVIAVLVGFVLTTIVQSSSVTVSVLVLLAGVTLGNGQPLVTPLTCLYFILGANIGSCAPAVMASFNASRNAKRTAFIHVMFNVVGLVVISIILMIASEPIINVISLISSTDKRFVANADTIFKIFQCIILLPFTNQLVKLSKKVIHAKGNVEIDESEHTLRFIGNSATNTPATAIVEITQEIDRMAGMVRENLEAAMKALVENDRSEFEAISAREKYVDYLSHRITEFMVRSNQYDLPLRDRERLGGLFHVVIDIERIGDHAINIMEGANKEKSSKVQFSEDGMNQLTEMYDRVIEIYDKAVNIFRTENKNEFDEVDRLEDIIDQMQIDCEKGHIKRMAQEKCSIEAGLIFTDVVIGLERIADHAMNIAYSILPEKK